MDLKQTISDAIARCAVNFPGYGNLDGKIMRAKVEIFAQGLSGFPEPAIAAAFDHHLRCGETFPIVSDILDQLRNNDALALPAPPSREDNALKATSTAHTATGWWIERHGKAWSDSVADGYSGALRAWLVSSYSKMAYDGVIGGMFERKDRHSSYSLDNFVDITPAPWQIEQWQNDALVLRESREQYWRDGPVRAESRALAGPFLKLSDVRKADR